MIMKFYIPQKLLETTLTFSCNVPKEPPKTGPCSCADNDAVTNSKAINIKLVIVFIRSSVFYYLIYKMMRTKEFMVVATFVLIYTFIISQWQILFGHTAHPETRFLLYPYNSCANLRPKNFGYISTHFFGINSKRKYHLLFTYTGPYPQ